MQPAPSRRPPGRPARPAAPAPAPAHPAARRRRILLGAAGVLLLLVGMCALTREEDSATLPAIPVELVGCWETAAPGFAGRSLELRPRHVVFGQGSVIGDERLPVESVEVGAEGARRYTIVYLDAAGHACRLALFLDGATLHLVNRPGVVWTRVSPPGALPGA